MESVSEWHKTFKTMGRMASPWISRTEKSTEVILKCLAEDRNLRDQTPEETASVVVGSVVGLERGALSLVSTNCGATW
jgi:hypothetical protein